MNCHDTFALSRYLLVMHFVFYELIESWVVGVYISWCINLFEKSSSSRMAFGFVILSPSLLTKDVTYFLFWFLLSYKNIYYSSYALYCERLFLVFWYPNIRKFEFYSLQLGLFQLACKRLPLFYILVIDVEKANRNRWKEGKKESCVPPIPISQIMT